MTELAKTPIEDKLTPVGDALEQKLARTADLLRSYRGVEGKEDVEAFARAEVTVDDPLRSHQATTQDA